GAAIRSSALWRTELEENRNAGGQAVLLKGEPYTIIGVLPENATTPLNADVYTALQPSRDGEGQATNFAAIIRLRDGATWPQANVEINRAWARTLRTRLFAERNPGGQVTYYSLALQKAETGTLGAHVIALMLEVAIDLPVSCV